MVKFIDIINSLMDDWNMGKCNFYLIYLWFSSSLVRSYFYKYLESNTVYILRIIWLISVNIFADMFEMLEEYVYQMRFKLDLDALAKHSGAFSFMVRLLCFDMLWSYQQTFILKVCRDKRSHQMDKNEENET